MSRTCCDGLLQCSLVKGAKDLATGSTEEDHGRCAYAPSSHHCTTITMSHRCLDGDSWSLILHSVVQ